MIAVGFGWVMNRGLIGKGSRTCDDLQGTRSGLQVDRGGGLDVSGQRGNMNGTTVGGNVASADKNWKTYICLY